MLDIVEITVKAGAGGRGKVSFHREKFAPLGGPDGGDGGKGGDVIVRADASTDTLQAFQYRRSFLASPGGDGENKGKHGKNGQDLVITVPEGTMVWQKTEVGQVLLGDLGQAGQEAAVAKGGKGGWGNTRFASSTNQAPRVAQTGRRGEENRIVLELRLIADAGIIGYPNAGKSTLLSRATAARPKIASYPFTTLEPVLGIVELGEQQFIIAEIPGLVEGAHLGRGLGHDFLRHITRTRVLIHLVDGTSADPVADMVKVNNELALFDAGLAGKPQIVAVNKTDLPEVSARAADIGREFQAAGVEPWFISAATGEGVPRLMAAVHQILSETSVVAAPVTAPQTKIFRPRPVDGTASVRREGGVFVVTAPGLEGLVGPQDEGARPAVLRQVQGELSRRGISRVLKRAGIKPGDRVRCGSFEWEW